MSVLRNGLTDRIDKQIAYCEEHNLKILDITLTEGYILQLQERFDMYEKKPLLSRYMGIPVCVTEVPEVVYVRAIRDTPLDRPHGRCYIRD